MRAISRPDTILVTGATGRLGLIAQLLVRRGQRIRAMTRDPRSQIAIGLAAAGAEIVRGDFDDRASLEAAASGAEIAIAAGTAHRAGPDGEARHGINFAEAAAAAGVSHLIYISGAGADRPTGVPVFESKRTVEERIRALGVPHTIIAPVYFMENAFNPWNRAHLQAARFPLPLPADRELKQVAIADIASFVAHAVAHVHELENQRIEIASDVLTGTRAAEILTGATGRRFEFESLPIDGVNPGMARLFEWLDRFGEPADVAGLRAAYPAVGWHTFEEWATAQDWERLEPRII
jgi:uncharacterized protein YbjT (DUF2867 family)